jgi:hypothetical protein
MADGARPLDAALSFEENRRHAGARLILIVRRKKRRVG